MCCVPREKRNELQCQGGMVRKLTFVLAVVGRNRSQARTSLTRYMRTKMTLKSTGADIINNGELPVEIYTTPGAPQGPLLTPARQHLLQECEAAIREGLGYAFKVGAALEIIKQKRLYLDHYDSFEEYCESRWNIHRSFAYRWIDAARIREVLSSIGDSVPMPDSEYQVRALAQARLSPEDSKRVWKDAVDSSVGGRVTGKLVASKVAALRALRGEADGHQATPARPTAQLDKKTVTEWFHRVSYALKALQGGDTEYAGELLGGLAQRLMEVARASRIVFKDSNQPVDYEI